MFSLGFRILALVTMPTGFVQLLKRSLLDGVAIAPLRECVKAPDIIIIMTNALQSMRLVQGYEYRTGHKPKIDLGAMCSELTVSPYLTGEMNVSVLCPSTRMLCKWSENDMAVGIPFELFEKITERVAATKPNY